MGAATAPGPGALVAWSVWGSFRLLGFFSKPLTFFFLRKYTYYIYKYIWAREGLGGVRTNSYVSVPAEGIGVDVKTHFDRRVSWR